MRTYTINTEPVKVSVNGKEFDLLKPDAFAQAEIIKYLADASKMQIASVDGVETLLRTGCDLIDSMLGGGACYQIFGNTPISLGHLFALLTQICKDCRTAYQEYLADTYLED